MPTIRRRLSISVAVAGWLGLALAVLALIVIVFGWKLGIPTVVLLKADYPGMALSTAICFLLCGLAIFYRAFLLGPKDSPLSLALGMAVTAIAGVNFVALAAGAETGIEPYLMNAVALTPAGARMSPATSICFVLAGFCIAIQYRHHGANRLPATIYSWTATAGVVFATVALVGYLYEIDRLYRIDVYAAMAGQTALGFAILFAGLHLVRPTWGWMRVMIASGPGSEALRMLLPGVLAAPIFFTWLSLTSLEGLSARTNTFIALLALGCAAFLVFLLFRSTLRLNRQTQEQRATAIRLNHALAERDLLLSEVYHRVKNNLQFMDAMLAIEGDRLADADAVNVLQTVRSRLHSLSRVHARLLGSHDLATVDLDGLLTEICEDLAEGAGIVDRGIHLETSIAAVTVDWERAIPMALLVNELVTNAIKHAFPDDRGGRIAVEVEGQPDQIHMRVRDDGVGENDETEERTSAGSLIVETLVRQLGADMKTKSSDGTSVMIDIPMTHA